MQTQLAKRKPSPEDNFKSKRLPGDILGVCWTGYGNEFTDDASLGNALINFGQAQSKLADCQDDFANSMKYDYLDKLEEGMNQFKEYQSLRKKLESRRLDYDAKLARLQKSKKEKPELEQEMQAAKMKYEEAEYDVIQKLASLQEFEDEHCQALEQLLELQTQYLTRSLEIVKQVKSNWGRGTPSVLSARQTKMTSVSRSELSVPRQASTDSLSHLSPRQPSTDSTSHLSPRLVPTPIARKLSFTQEEQPRNIPPPVLPRKRSQSTLPKRKALYDFGATGPDELSFKTNDLIQVVEEVDEGWWLGELEGRRGIFPVNYTEPVLSGPPIPSRPPMVSSISSSTRIQTFVEEPEEVQDPFNQPSPHPSPVPHRIPTTRTPPPPPSSSRPVMQSSKSNTTIRTAPNTPQVRVATTDYFARCTECGCDEFTANVFKKGHCNNCFHKH
ncbi:hypothetical protein G6F62_009753 [Rhizopus arrhizus]|nr:hypothetical protein G6F23_010593 [Rhizopus arrhizus]KAG1220145.1 hypothetical protein G6F35_006923 [Rhizopus arrhizus]KAG1323290.1 hypothetical protein G6F62_009753 [Rhizopus arrhizus]